MTKLSFPGLNIDWFEINPIAFSIGNLSVHWYGVIIAFGFMLAILYCIKIKDYSNLTSDNICDVALFGAPVGIICARLYYVIFSFSDYKDNLWDVFKIWEGGLAIYGGIIGAVLTAYIYCKVKNLSVAKVFDVCIIGVVIGQIIGRWGNFVNGEAYGAQTDVFWRMGIVENGKEIFVHPTFFYESLWNLGVFIVLNIILRHRKFDGQVFLSYLLFYSLGRVWIEGLRSDSLYLGGLRVSQILSLLLIIVSSFAIIYNITYKNKNKGL
ncbi:MAG: prolipoprotein diacylglyceryl transferase [Ruminococcaceae bacterium]|nr:prolipoprotein diacylglyceryl transferase [Oscillospiraceae bacterium]